MACYQQGLSGAVMSTFGAILDEALSHHDIDTIEARVPTVRSCEALAALPDDRVLSTMAQRIFSAGFRWSVVQTKWPDIEAAFDTFAVGTVADYDAERIGALRQDRRIIRHPGKIAAIVHNAGVMRDFANETGPVATWLAEWPDGDVVGLWHAIAKRFKQMGGASGPRFLRALGRDTFILTPDVLSTLKRHGVYSGKGTAKRDQRAIQEHFNAWRSESGRGYASLSMVLASAAGPRH
mgnify:CR=1 FL=1